VFWIVVLVQMFIRDGYDLRRHPISLLALGDLGWIQIVNFFVTGLLILAGAVGLRRALWGGRGATWTPRLAGALGAGLIVAGTFPTDAVYGFPAGAPSGLVNPSWHALIHAFGALVGVVGLATAMFVHARRLTEENRPGLAVLSRAAALAMIALACWPDQTSNSLRMAITVTIAFIWLSAVTASLTRAGRQVQGTETEGAASQAQPTHHHL
jgi:hypothetical protein